MQRRHFIKLTGAGVGGLLISGWDKDEKAATEKVPLPQKVRIKLDDGFHDMASSDKQSWHYEEVVVLLKYDKNGALQTSIQSPASALHTVQLQWQYATLPNTKLSGDHWERTYGDGAFETADINRKMPWYFIQSNEDSTVCFGVKTGCKAFCYWTVGDGIMQLTMDVRNGGSGVQLSHRTLHSADIITTRNKSNENTFYTARRFCSLLCSTPRLAKQPVYGINDWYFAYGNNTPALIKKQTALLTDLATDTSNRPFSVVDAGWAKYSPLLPGDCCWMDDFSQSNEKFPDMHVLADEIKKLAMRPALWTRPLCGTHDDKRSLLLSSIPGRDDAKKPVLDPSIEENIARIQHNISTYRNWGYEMVKHDFSTYDIMGKWGFEMTDDMTTLGWHFNDRSKTSAEIILHLYQSIREAAQEMYLIGCNTISHLSAGIFEQNRVGDDTSGKEWDRTRKMGVNTLAFRLMQHDIFYAADGDCVGLTKDVPWEKNKQWMQLLAESGTPLFISTQPDALGAEQKVAIKQNFAIAAQKLPVGEPLDWLTNPFPTEWKLNGKVRSFEW